MNPMVIVIALILVGWASGRLLMRRFPTVSRAQVFCATAAWIGGVSIAARPVGSEVWHYTGLTIAVVTGSFLLMALHRHWGSPRPSRSS